MNTTATATESTIVQRHHALEGLYMVEGLGEYITHLTIERSRKSACDFSIFGPDAATEGYALVVAYDLFAPATVEKFTYERFSTIHVHVTGSYQGIPVAARLVVANPDACDRIRDLPPDRDLLLALADRGPVPTPAEMRDQIWASCAGQPEPGGTP